MQSLDSILVLVKNKTVFVHFGEILKQAVINVKSESGKMVFHKEITLRHFEVFHLDERKGKYWIKIKSDNLNAKKIIHLK